MDPVLKSLCYWYIRDSDFCADLSNAAIVDEGRRLTVTMDIDLTQDNYEACQWAVTKGYTELFKRLYVHADANACQAAFENAVQENRLEIVQLLLQDPRVAPTEYCLIDAVECGYVEMVAMLLADGRVNPESTLTDVTESLLCCPKRRSAIEAALQLLYDDPRVSKCPI